MSWGDGKMYGYDDIDIKCWYMIKDVEKSLDNLKFLRVNRRIWDFWSVTVKIFLNFVTQLSAFSRIFLV